MSNQDGVVLVMMSILIEEMNSVKLVIDLLCVLCVVNILSESNIKFIDSFVDSDAEPRNGG